MKILHLIVLIGSLPMVLDPQAGWLLCVHECGKMEATPEVLGLDSAHCARGHCEGEKVEKERGASHEVAAPVQLSRSLVTRGCADRVQESASDSHGAADECVDVLVRAELIAQGARVPALPVAILAFAAPRMVRLAPTGVVDQSKLGCVRTIVEQRTVVLLL